MLKQMKIATLSLIALIANPMSLAHDYEAGKIHIDHPWSREARQMLLLLADSFS